MVFIAQNDHFLNGSERAAGTANPTFSIALLRAASLRVPQSCWNVMVQGAAGTNNYLFAGVVLASSFAASFPQLRESYSPAPQARTVGHTEGATVRTKELQTKQGTKTSRRVTPSGFPASSI